MNQPDVMMDVTAVTQLSRRLEQMGSTLGRIGRVMDALLSVLKSSAFMGGIGQAADARYVNELKPRLEQLRERCHQMSADLATAVRAYESGDEQGATRFY